MVSLYVEREFWILEHKSPCTGRLRQHTEIPCAIGTTVRPSSHNLRPPGDWLSIGNNFRCDTRCTCCLVPWHLSALQSSKVLA